MADLAFTLFSTPIGDCALAWGPRGVVGVELPQADPDATRRRVKRRFPDAEEASPPAPIGAAIAEIIALLDGEPRDFADVTLDMDRAPEFQRKVWEIARSIPPGETVTYGEIAERLGDRLLAQEVGKALGANPFPIIVPCHRVMAAGGKIGGFSAHGGIATKRRMLAIESVLANPSEPDLFSR
jgi:methylated-DNA-[protein]-cysteine S-methyltransferase